MWFDGEENQLEGSRWWAAHPTLPIDRCFAMLNCDMIGRNEITKIFCGVEKDGRKEPTYPKWAAELREAESRFGATFDWTEFDPYIKRSDHWPFMEKGVPALFFTGGLHADYHKEGDRIEKINFAKEELIGRILYSILAKVADRTDPLK
jgi:Zn-dependent M28 family amino/carboxypeptidase